MDDNGIVFVMLWSHLDVKSSRKIHKRQISQNGDGGDDLVAVTGYTWQLWDVCGNYGMYVATVQ